MNIQELDSYRLADTVKFHDRLNPRLWDSSEHLRPEVKTKLMEVALDFQEFLGVPDLDVKDITISGSNAAYNYTPTSDIDLHIVIDIPDVSHDEVYRELFNAKKYQYNDEHDIRIRGADVELYAQDSKQPHHSQGIYSLLRNSWTSVPTRNRAKIDDVSARSKFEDLAARIDDTIKSHNVARMDKLAKKIKTMRQTGLEQQGEFGSDNIAFKLLRNNGYIQRLWDAKQKARDLELSLAELHRPRQPVVYGFGDAEIDEASLADMRAAFQTELKPLTDPDNKKVYRSREEHAQDAARREQQKKIAAALTQPLAPGGPSGVRESPDGVNPTTAMFLTEDDPESIVQEFIEHTADRLGIARLPKVFIHHDEDWSKANHSFGMYVPEQHELHVSLGNRHLLDILRTTAHELCHCAQHEQESLPDNAGVTGSDWENEAHAVAGIIMRDFADAHPDYFKMAPVQESASGYIPTKKQAKDPRYSMALTQDIRPGQVGQEANKLNLKTDSQGRPALLMKTANLQESLAAEFAVFEAQDLFEVKMTSKNLANLAKDIKGARVGLEFEMIVPDVSNDENSDLEPDYDQDERVRDIDDAVNFFDDGDYNGRNEIRRLRERMESDYFEWQTEKIDERWHSDQGLEFFAEYLNREDPFDDEEAEQEARNELQAEYSNELSTEDFEKMLSALVDKKRQNYIQEQWDEQGRNYDYAQEEFADEQRDDISDSEWLSDQNIRYASDVESNYGDVTWPYYTSGGDSEGDIESVALNFMNAMGMDSVAISSSYHGSYKKWVGNGWVSIGSNKPDDCFTIEPDGSLEGDDSSDTGLEFVSPPIPLEDIGTVMSQVQNWAGNYGAYTGDHNKTSIHTNISVPGYDINKLDYLKAALLLGDEYVLREFDRIGNTYAAPAIEKVKALVKQNPEKAQQLLDKMKSQLNAEASKLIHSGQTNKFTSINTKDNRVEFRSPGGDYLSIIADNPQKMMDTINRMVVTLDAAMDPNKYKQEYQKKLYKMLTGQQSGRDAETGAKREMKADNKDLLNIFSRYAAGELPKAALKSFVRQAQLERKVAKGNSSAAAPSEPIPGSTLDLQRQRAAQQLQGVDTSSADAAYEVFSPYGRQYGTYATQQQAQTAAQELANQHDIPMHVGPGGGYRTFTARPRRNTDAAQGGIVDLAGEPSAAAPQSNNAPFGNQFSGQWRVVDGAGRELYVFRGVGNNQGDANRIAANWARENNYSGALDVLPVMIESVQESLTEIENMKQSHFTGGKDMLDSFKKPGKKHLKPLPGGTDLLYSITKDNYGSYVYIVDPGIPGITTQSIVASLSLTDLAQVGLPNSVQVGTITVDEDYRGRGLAKALYGIVLTIMRKTLISGSSQTPGGRRNWLSLATIPGVEVQGLVSLSNRGINTTIGDPKSKYNKYVEKTIDRVMELGGQFISQDKNWNYWAFDVEPGNGQLQPVVRNALSKLYGYDSDALLMAKWTGA